MHCKAVFGPGAPPIARRRAGILSNPNRPWAAYVAASSVPRDPASGETVNLALQPAPPA